MAGRVCFPRVISLVKGVVRRKAGRACPRIRNGNVLGDVAFATLGTDRYGRGTVVLGDGKDREKHVYSHGGQVYGASSEYSAKRPLSSSTHGRKIWVLYS